LPDGLFSSKNTNLGTIFRASDWKMWIFLWPFVICILWPFGIFYDHLAHFVFIWYIFSSFGIMHHEKSGNPAVSIAQKLLPRILLPKTVRPILRFRVFTLKLF
jgi:hypothetical protein